MGFAAVLGDGVGAAQIEQAHGSIGRFVRDVE